MSIDDPNQIECPQCGAEVSLAWSRCPECGLVFYPEGDPEEAPGRRSSRSLPDFLSWLARSLITFLVIGALLGAFAGMALGSNWLGWMLGGLLLFGFGWGLLGWFRRRGR